VANHDVFISWECIRHFLVSFVYLSVSCNTFPNSPMTNAKAYSGHLKSTVLKYLLLIVVGVSIIVFCSFFQHITGVDGEYHYSQFLQGNYLTIPAVSIFFIVGLGVGYFWRLNPWLASFCLFFIFPLTSIIEAAVYKDSHNLIPFEFVFFFCFAMPCIIAVYIGRFIFKQVAKRKQQLGH